jgi:hypothetical protein
MIIETERKVVLGIREQPVREADNFAICKPIVYRMCDPQYLATV